MTHQRRILVATGGHAFNADAFSDLLASLDGFACSQAEQPAVRREFVGDRPADWDAFLMYDMPGYEFHPDHSPPTLFDPPEDFRRNFLALVERGHGFVFLHHALASWPTWEDYTSVIGGRFRFVRDGDNPDSGYRHAVAQRITPVALGHPVLAGLDGGFGTGLALGAFTGSGSSDIGSDVTIPCRALASLKSWLRLRRMPGPKEML